MRLASVLTLAALAAVLMTAGCGARLSGDLQSRLLETEQGVTKPWNPSIYVQPAELPDRPLTAVMLPFRMQQAMEYGPFYAKELSRYVFEVWAQRKMFPIFEFLESSPFKSQEQAVALARAKGADLAVTGSVQQLLAGGELGATAVSFRMMIYDARSGQLLWSMAHAGSMEPGETREWVFLRTRSTVPHDPLFAIATELAYELSYPVKAWLTQGAQAHARAGKAETTLGDGAGVSGDCFDCPDPAPPPGAASQDFPGAHTGRVPIHEGTL